MVIKVMVVKVMVMKVMVMKALETEIMRGILGSPPNIY